MVLVPWRVAQRRQEKPGQSMVDRQPALIAHAVIIGQAAKQQKQIEDENIDRTRRRDQNGTNTSPMEAPLQLLPKPK
jgi:hypothetical protein